MNADTEYHYPFVIRALHLDEPSVVYLFKDFPVKISERGIHPQSTVSQVISIYMQERR